MVGKMVDRMASMLDGYWAETKVVPWVDSTAHCAVELMVLNLADYWETQWGLIMVVALVETWAGVTVEKSAGLLVAKKVERWEPRLVGNWDSLMAFHLERLTALTLDLQMAFLSGLSTVDSMAVLLALAMAAMMGL